jgi:hypothetical protein
MHRLITITGPDGAGKSAVTESLVDRLRRVGPVEHHHSRLRSLPSSAASRTETTDPHGQVPYGLAVSIVKVVYLYVDWFIGWLLRAQPFRRQGGWIIVERGWWDLLVDPARYRLHPTPRLTRFLGRLRPGSDLLITLNASPEVLLGRKQELSPKELTRQLDVWEALTRSVGGEVIDVDRPVEETVDEICRLLGVPLDTPTATPGEHGQRWARVSTRKQDWAIPTQSTRISTAALLIHQPIRPRAQVLWSGARILAGTGALKLLPDAPTPAILDLVAPHIPPGGSVAVATRRAGTRSVALLLTSRGSPYALAKLAVDEAGIEKLRREAAAYARFGSLLEAPLSAPRLLHADRGIAIFEPVQWRLRRNPWDLDPDLAHALGRFHASSDAPEGGLVHGDVAPWNLMRTATGWSLIDWEEARDGEPPFGDAFHFLVQSQLHLGRPTETSIVDGITRLHGPVGDALTAYARGADVGTSDIVERFDQYLVSMITGRELVRPVAGSGATRFRQNDALVREKRDRERKVQTWQRLREAIDHARVDAGNER